MLALSVICAAALGPVNSRAASAGKHSAEAVTTGRSQFLQNCSGCHGANGQGGEGPSLHKLNVAKSEISNIVAQGFKGEMPAFTKLKPSQLTAIAEYVRSL